MIIKLQFTYRILLLQTSPDVFLDLLLSCSSFAISLWHSYSLAKTQLIIVMYVIITRHFAWHSRSRNNYRWYALYYIFIKKKSNAKSTIHSTFTRRQNHAIIRYNNAISIADTCIVYANKTWIVKIKWWSHDKTIV